MKPVPLKTSRRIEINRDQNGVPHVQAANWLDALYGLGYMHAMDRGTQLLFARSVASGRAAEEIADSQDLRDTDRFFRRMGLHLNLDEEVGLLNDHDFSQLTSYCEGVNDGLAGLGRSWPMWATGYVARPWNQISVLMIGKLLSFGGLAVSQMQNERLVIQLIHAGANARRLRELFAPRLDNIDFDVVRQVKLSDELSDEAIELLTDLPRLAGSNAWAVAPQRSATGSALLASDPHLEVNRLPAIWYEAVLNWDSHYVLGATLPGCPLYAVARTRQLAWGVTYMKGDTVDFFIEDCRRGGGTGWQYRRGKRWHDFRIRDETIKHKGGEDSLLRIYENEQGTLDSDPEELGEGFHLSVAWTGNRPGNGQAISTWLNVIEQPTTLDGMNVARECVQPTLCWVFADQDGHIGLQGCGRFPKRGNGHVGLGPIPAWDARNHWQGILPSRELPRIYDPPEGYVATANEECNRPGRPMLVTQPLPAYRKRRIDEVLEDLPQATLEDMQHLQYDLVSLQARDLLSTFLPLLEEGEVKERLSNWDFSYRADSVEATLFLHLYRNVIVELLGHEKAIGWRRMFYLCSRAGYSVMVLTGADRTLLLPHSHWWEGETKGELIRRAAAAINLDELVPWSKINNFHFADRFFGSHQVGRMLGYASRQFPMPGCHATIFQGHVCQTATRETTFAPSYHFVTDMGQADAWTNLPGGPSENRFSRYYKNDIARWFNGDYKRLAAKGEE